MTDILLTLCDMITKIWVVKWILNIDESDESQVEKNSDDAVENIKKQQK